MVCILQNVDDQNNQMTTTDYKILEVVAQKSVVIISSGWLMSIQSF